METTTTHWISSFTNTTRAPEQLTISYGSSLAIIIISIVAFWLNILTFSATLNSSRKLSNYYLLVSNQCLVDVVMSGSFSVTNLFFLYYDLSDKTCLMWFLHSAGDSSGSLAMLNLLSVSIDQLVAVRHPLR